MNPECSQRCKETEVKQIHSGAVCTPSQVEDTEVLKQLESATSSYNHNTEVKHINNNGDHETIQYHDTAIKLANGQAGGSQSENASVQDQYRASGNQGNNIPMTKIHKAVLESFGSKLESELCPDEMVLNFLYQEAVLDENSFETVKAVNDRRKRIHEMLRILPFKGDNAYATLCRAICDYSKQRYLVEQMEKTCSEMADKIGGTDAFSTYRLAKVPGYYIDREHDVDAVLNLLGEKSVVGIVGKKPASKLATHGCENSDDEADHDDAAVVGIRGFGGVGKTVLAQKVCSKMKTNLPVIWLTIGQKPNVVNLFNQIHQDLVKTDGKFSDEQNAADWLRKYTEKPDGSLLLVLDDVWSANHAAPFTGLAQGSKVLITTRDQSILDDLDATAHALDLLDLENSKKLLIKSAKISTKDLTDDLTGIISGILKFLRGLPLAIVLIGSSLRKKGAVESSRWRDRLEQLKQVKGTLWETSRKRLPLDKEYKYNLFEAFEVSFQALSSKENHPASQSNYVSLLQRRFLDFGLFPDDVQIPSNVLKHLWKSRLTSVPGDNVKKELYIMKDHLDALAETSLISKVEKPNIPTTLVENYQEEALSNVSSDPIILKSCFTIHDLLLDYARYKLDHLLPNGLKEAHIEFLNSYSACSLTDDSQPFLSKHGMLPTPHFCWWQVNDDGYFYHNAAHHLVESGQSKELQALIWNIQWIERKLDVTDITAILKDFSALRVHIVADADKLLENCLILSSHILTHYKNQLCPQLLGRVIDHSCNDLYEFAESIKRYVKYQPVMLIPEAPCLSQPDGYRLRSLRHVGTVLCAAITEDQQYVYTASSDNQIRRFELKTGQAKILGDHACRHNGMIFAMALEGQFMVTGAFDNSVRYWLLDGVENSRSELLSGHTDAVFSVDVSLARKLAISGSADRSIRIWDLVKFKCRYVIENAHERCVRAVSLTKDNKFIVSGGEDSFLKIWDLQSGNLCHSWVAHENYYINAVRVSPDNTKLVSGSTDCSLKIWDLQTRKLLTTCTGHMLDVFGCFVSSDSKHVLSGSLDKTACLWNIDSGEVERVFYGHGAGVWALNMSSDNKLCVTGGEDQLAIVWNCDLSDSVSDPALKRHSLDVTSIAATPDGSLVVSASRDKTLKIWDYPDMHLKATLEDAHADKINCVIVTKDQKSSKAYVAISASNDKTICIWSIAPTVLGKPQYVLDGQHKYAVTSLCSSEDGHYLFSGSLDNTVIVWDLFGKTPIHNFNTQNYFNVRHLSLIGSQLYVCFEDSVVMWKNIFPCDSLDEKPFLSKQANSKYDFPTTPRHTVPGFFAGLGDASRVRVLDVSRCIEYRIDTHMGSNDLVSAICSTGSDAVWTGYTSGKFTIVKSGQVPRSIGSLFVTHESPVTCLKTVDLDSTKPVLAAGFASGRINVWFHSTNLVPALILADKKCLKTTQLDCSVVSLDLCQTSERCLLAACSKNKQNPEISIWNIESEITKILSLSGHTDLITSVVFVKINGTEKVLSGSLDKTVKLWNIKTGDLQRTDTSDHTYGILSLAVSPSGTSYATGGYENFLELRSIEEGTIPNKIFTEDYFSIKDLYIRDNKTIVCAFPHHHFIEVDIKSRKIINKSFAMQKEHGAVARMFNSKLAITGDTHCYAKVWNIYTGETVCRFPTGHTRALLALCTMSNGSVVTGSYEKVLKIWDISNISPQLVSSFAFEHAILALQEFKPGCLAVGLLNGQVCFLRLSK